MLLIRYFQTVVAWNHAFTYLDHSKLFRSGLEVTINIIQPPPSFGTDDLEIEKLLDEFLLEVSGPESKSYLDDREKIIESFKLKALKRFSGAVHCEATLMTLIYAYSSGQEISNVPPSFKELFEVGVSCFGCDTLSFPIGFQQGCWSWKEVLLVL
jgi:hypothetical protein